MSDPTAQEPTMEEILASIRRIISEDDAPAAEPEAKVEEPVAAAPPPPPAPAPPPPPEPVHVAPPPRVEEHEEEDVLELTEPAPAPAPAETHGDLDVFDVEPPSPAPGPVEPAKAPVSPVATIHPHDDDRLVSGGSEDRVASHFGLLSQSIAMPASGVTLEDVVRQLLRPLLKDWLDEHLPGIVEEKVQAEVERIARRRV